MELTDVDYQYFEELTSAFWLSNFSESFRVIASNSFILNEEAVKQLVWNRCWKEICILEPVRNNRWNHQNTISNSLHEKPCSVYHINENIQEEAGFNGLLCWKNWMNETGRNLSFIEKTWKILNADALLSFIFLDQNLRSTLFIWTEKSIWYSVISVCWPPDACLDFLALLCILRSKNKKEISYPQS